ncbi:MAG: ATP-dependent DNA helicase RecG [Ghiorsea sp.]
MPIEIYPSFYLPIERIDGIGPVAAKKLQKLGYHSLGSLLFHLPKAWVDDRTITPINMLIPKQEARIQGNIQSRRSSGFGRKATVFITIADDTGASIQLSFFHANYMMSDARLQEGQTITVRGVPDKWGSKYQMTHPEWSSVARFAAGWVPKYASLAGFSGKKIAGWIKNGLKLLAKEAQSPLDELLVNDTTSLPHLVQALLLLHNNQHFDPESTILQQALTRLQLEELLVYLNLMQKQRKLAEIPTTPMPSTVQEEEFIASLPFPLTPAQQHVWQEIGQDLASGKRMHRLLQGDVGAGKTWIAALGMVRAAAFNKQSAIMAPTEVLAQQHANTLTELLEPMGITVALLTGSTKKRERTSLLKRLLAGEIDVLVGTHALLTHDVVFKDLALAMVDEQHRFGVEQRWALSKKGEAVHLLAMTATPIPRSLALALYGDMHLSLMQGLPEGRKLIETRLIAEAKRAALLDAVERMLAQNGSVYWIVPRIDEDEETTSVDERLLTLKQRFPHENVLGLHGKMKPKDKLETLDAFSQGDCRILVSTTVVEVGVNVPQARVMVIEHADMYGLAQLHQLRGRVGRSSEQSFCMLMPSQRVSETAKSRLSLMTNCHNGLELAEADLKHRGAGDSIGTRQSGEAGFKLIDPVWDADLIRQWCDSDIIGQVKVSDDVVHFWRPLAEEVD